MQWLLFLLFLAISAGAQTASTPKRIAVEGHRGARWAMPENTLPAFRYAIDVGADVLEMDLGVTKDNVLVVSHDLEIKPSICKGPAELPRAIRQLTLAEIKQFDCGWQQNPDFPTQRAIPGTRMPTLEEVFRELSPLGTFRFNIEMKSHPTRRELTPPPDEFARLLVEQIRRFKVENRVVIQSFDFRMLKALASIAPGIKRAALFVEEGEAFLAVAKRAGDVQVLSPHLRLVTPENVREAHAAGLTVVPWTANQPEEWQKLIDANVDAIITDNPKGLVQYLKERKLR
jgi:glycerophosphoryl diester phosphodiesterase